MSILSSDRFQLGYSDCIVVETESDIQIIFESNQSTNITTTSSSNSIIFTGYNYTPTPNIFAESTASCYQLRGFRLFFLEGVLRCHKLEIPHTALVFNEKISVENAYQYWTENPCSPNSVVQALGSSAALGHIHGKIIILSSRQGIVVPAEFTCIAEQYDGSGRQITVPTFDWLAYPLVREVNSVAFAKNLGDPGRNLLCPTHHPMNFKQLVEYYYGTSTPKMLEEIWKILSPGSESIRMNFAVGLPQTVIDEAVAHTANTLEVNTTYVTQIGNKHLQSLVFTLGPAIYKTMGFDYLYQILPNFANDSGLRMREYVSESIITADIKVLLKCLSRKKIMRLLREEIIGCNNLNLLHDTANMLYDYDSAEKIPKTLREYYPNGLTVDYKFQTIKELHDKVSAQHVIIKAEADKKDIPVHEAYDILDGKELNGLKLVVPRDTAILSVWGKTLNICIASYGDKAARADTLLLGVLKNGEITYCIEFRALIIPRFEGEMCAKIMDDTFLPTEEPTIIREAIPMMLEKEFVSPIDQSTEPYLIPSIVQFRAHHNGDPSKEDRDAVETMLINWVKENMPLFEPYGEKLIQKYSNGLYVDREGMLNVNVAYAPPRYNYVIQNNIV